MKSFKVFFQGEDKNGITLYRVMNYTLEKWNALAVIKDFEAKSKWNKVQINNWYEFTKSKKPKLPR